VSQNLHLGICGLILLLAPAGARAGAATDLLSGDAPAEQVYGLEGLPVRCGTSGLPSIQLSPNHGYAGQTVAVSGQGVSGSSGVRIAWMTGPASVTAAVVPLGPSGAYSTIIVVPDDIATTRSTQAPDHDELYDSDATAGPQGIVQLIANDFALTQPERITGLRWWGGYSYDPGVPSTDDFTIRIFGEANGLPGQLLYQEQVGADVNRTATGHTIHSAIGDFDEFAYRAALASPFDAQPGVTYWLVISNNTAGHPAVWGWEESNEGSGLMAYSLNGGPWASIALETAFELLAEATPVQVCAAATGLEGAEFACADFTIEAPPPGTVQGTIPIAPDGAGFDAEINLYNAVGRRAGSAPISPDGSFVISGAAPGSYNAGVTGNLPNLVAGGPVNITPGGVSILDLQELNIPQCDYGAYVDRVTVTPNHEIPRGDPTDYAGLYLSLGAAAEDRVNVTFTANVQVQEGVSLEWVHFHIEEADGGLVHIGSVAGRAGRSSYSATYNVSQLPYDGIVPDGRNFLRVTVVTDEGPTPECRLAWLRIKVLKNPLDHPIIRDAAVSWNAGRVRYELSGKIPELADLPATWPDPPPDIPLIGEIENTLDAYVSFAGNLELDGDLRVTSMRAHAEALLFSQEVFDPIDEDILPPGAEDLVFDITDIRNTRYPFGPITLVSFDERFPVYSGPLATFWGIVTVNASISLGVDGSLELEGALKPLRPAVNATLTAEVVPSLSLSIWVDLLAVVSAGADATVRVLFGLPLRIDTERGSPVWFDDPCLGLKVILDVWARVNLWFWSHRWDLASWELFCTERGGCGFCDDSPDGASPLAPPDVMSSPWVAAGPDGKMIAVYTENTIPGQEYPTVQVLARFWNQSLNDWGPAMAISDGSRFVQDPVAAFVGPDGHVIVAYTENTMTLVEQEAAGNDLPANLKRQEIFAAYWDGTAWSITQLTDDVLADGRAAMAGDGGGATLAWTRDAGDGDITTRDDLQIAVRNFDYTAAAWDELALLSAAPSNSQVSVARADGYAVLAWTSEGDADPATNADRRIALAEGLPGGGWTIGIPSMLPAGAEQPSVAIDPMSFAVEAAFVVRTKDGDGVTDTGIGDQARLWVARRTGTLWQAGQVLEGADAVRGERPRVTVTEAGETLILFRRFGASGTSGQIGQLAMMQKGPGSGAFSPPLYVTDENRQHWQQAMAVNYATGQAVVLNVSRAPIDVGGSPAPRGSAGAPATTYPVQTLAGGNDPVEAFVIELGPDAALEPSMTASQQHAAPGTNVQLTATLRNFGRLPASALTVSFYAGTPETGTFLGAVTIGGPIGFNESQPVQFQVSRVGGPQLITAEVICGGDVNAANNRAAVDLGALPPPKFVAATESQVYPSALKLTWIPPQVFGLQGFRVLRGETAGGPYEFVGESAVPIFHDLLLRTGQTYYYVVQAVGDDCVLSATSAEAAGTVPIPGDFDGDGDVDLSDFTQFQLCFGGSTNPPAATCPPGVDADLDGDGDVDLADFLIFQQNFTGSQ